MEAIQDNRRNAKYGRISEIYNKVRKIKNIEIAIAVILLAIVLIVYAGLSNAQDVSSKKKVTNNQDVTSDKLEMKLE